MTITQIAGPRTGAFNEFQQSLGTPAIVSTRTRRSANYSLFVVGTQQSFLPAGYAANGKEGLSLDEAFVVFHFSVGALPSSGTHSLVALSSVQLRLSSAGVLSAVGATTVDNVLTGITAGSHWYEVKAHIVRNATSTFWARPDDGTWSGPHTCTANNTAFSGANFAPAVFGSDNGQEYYYSDVVFTTGEDPGSGQVHMAVNTGNSAANTHWTFTGASKWEDTNSIPPSDSHPISSLTTAGDRFYSAVHATAATLGILTNIKAVKTLTRMREPTATSTLGAIGIRSGTTNFTTTPVDIGNTTYIHMGVIYSEDPNTSSPWTHAGFNAAEALVMRSSADNSNINCSWMGLMTWSTDDSPAPSFVPFRRSLLGVGR